MGGKGSTPPAPNYSQLATEQAALDKGALAGQNFANRPTQNTPWGSTTWGTSQGVDPATGLPVTQWTQNQTLNPQLDAGLRDQFALGAGRSNVAAGMMDQVRGNYADPMDYSGFTNVGGGAGDTGALRDQATQTAYDSLTSRLDPQYEQQGQAMEVKLRNMGLRAGDEAYDAAMGNFDRAKTDAYSNANAQAFQLGQGEAQQMYNQGQGQQAQNSALRQQEIAEAIRKRNMPLEEQGLLLAGQGVQPAAQANFTASGQAPAANMMGAANSQYNAASDAYNAKQAQRQGMMSGAASTGLGVAQLAMMSDRRLKTDIHRLGTLLGRPFYSFMYLWGETGVGFMSDEVNPEAVIRLPNGYDMVNYAAVTPA